jgi:hypothetical protein
MRFAITVKAAKALVLVITMRPAMVGVVFCPSFMLWRHVIVSEACGILHKNPENDPFERSTVSVIYTLAT